MFFCASRKVWSRKVRYRSPENVVEEIKYLQSKGLSFINFADDIFGVNEEHIIKLCNSLIKYCPGIKWECELSVKLVKDNIIFLMKKAGCVLIHLGIESGNNTILKEIRKGITIEEAISACKSIKRHGIGLATFFIVGFPQDTEETIGDTICAMKMTRSDYVIYSVFTPYPGTESFEFCKERGLIKDKHEVFLYNHLSPLNNFCLNIEAKKFKGLISNLAGAPRL